MVVFKKLPLEGVEAFCDGCEELTTCHYYIDLDGYVLPLCPDCA